MSTLDLFPDGLTCEEVEDLMRGKHQTISPRIHELSRAGRIRDSGQRRMTKSGREAIVWVPHQVAA